MKNEFCGECGYLHPPEAKQTDGKEKHYCIKYGKRVYHFNDHPELHRLTICKE